MRNPLSLYLKITLGVIFVSVIGYNFYVANLTKFEGGGDAIDYISLGVGLAKFNKYGHIAVSNKNNINAIFEGESRENEKIVFLGNNTWRAPVWPFLIAGVFILFGYDLLYILILKFVLHILGTLFFYKILKNIRVSEFMLIFGTFLYGISPAWQLYSRVFLSEPITLFFLTLWLYLLVRFLKGYSGIIFQGLVAGIAVLSHPYYIFLPLSVWLFLLIFKQLTFRQALTSVLIFSFTLSLWAIRNSVVLDTDKFILTTSSGAVMAKGWNSEVLKNHTNTKGDLADETLVLEGFESKELTQDEVDKLQLYTAATLHFIKTNPEDILPILITKWKSAFNPFPETAKPGILETGRWLMQLLALLSLIYIFLFLKNKFLLSLALGLVLSTILITALTYSGFRFRMPQLVLELILIVLVIEQIIQKFSKARFLTSK